MSAPERPVDAPARDPMPRLMAQGRGRRLAGIVVLACGQALAAGIAAFAMREVFSHLRAPAQGLPASALAWLAGAGLLLALLRWGEQLAAERLGLDYAGALRVKIYRHVARMGAAEVSQRRRGALALRFVGDLTAIRHWVSLGLARLVSAAIVLPAAVGVLYLLHPALALVATPPLLLALLVIGVGGRGLGPAHARLRRRRARLAANLDERIGAAPWLGLLGRTRTEVRQLEHQHRLLRGAAMARMRRAAALRVVPDAAAGLCAAGVLAAAWLWGVPVAEVAAALAALGLVWHPMRGLAMAWDRHAAWSVARARCVALLSQPARGRTLATPVPTGPAHVRLRSACTAMLRDWTADVRPGQTVALVGPHGAGKSTLLRLVAGLELSQAGRVRVDGVAPSRLEGAARRGIGHLDAQAPILAGSLRRALTLGIVPRPDDAAVIDAAHAWGLAPVLERLGGLDGAVGEGARNLSGGERQRVHLARLALLRPRLLLLDEPLAALDGEGLDLLTGLIASTGATTLIATSQLALARRMEVLWFVDQGRLVEQGPPDAVLHGDGPAARHFKLRPAA